MYCPKCGKYLDDGTRFCPSCGASAESNVAPQNTSSSRYQMQGKRPKQDVRLVSFLLGFLLNIIGIIIAVLIYSGKKDEYEEDPTLYALLWSFFGSIFIFVILFVFLFAVMGISIGVYGL